MSNLPTAPDTAYHLFSLSNLPSAFFIVLVFAVIPGTVAYFAKRKGYSFCLFFIATFMSYGSLLAFLAIAMIVSYLPKREKTENVTIAEKNPGDESNAASEENDAVSVDSAQKNSTSNNETTSAS